MNFITEEKAIQRLERENKEQLETIQKLLINLSLPKNILNKFTNNRFQEDNLKISQLKKILKEKEQKYISLQKQITEYVHISKLIEKEIEQNEEERGKIWNQFQEEISTPRNEEENNTFEDLSEQIFQKTEEKKLIKKKNREIQNQFIKFKQELQDSTTHIQKLQTELQSYQKQLDASQVDESLIQVYNSNQNLITNLKEQINKANARINSLRGDNKILKKAISDLTNSSSS